MRLVLFLPLLVLLLASACSNSSSESSGQLRVVATTTQIGDFARNVGGDRISLNVLLRPNQDAHDFEPEPSQIRALSNANLVLLNGVGLDQFVDRALGNSRATVVTVSDGIRIREDHDDEDDDHDDEEAHDDDHDHDGEDPHVWFSVVNARKMVENVRDAFIDADPDNASFYRDNASAYLQRLGQLDDSIKQQIATIPASCRKLVTNHHVLGYYADAYGFEVVGAVIPSSSSDAQPSAANVADIVRKIREQRVPAVFAEASANPALINQVGREAGVKVVTDLYGDSLGAPNSDGATYIDMMQSNTKKIVAALKDCAS
jgi:ABC-type Zn uptake system ZnuABC Zn-binding protein ZnuA